MIQHYLSRSDLWKMPAHKKRKIAFEHKQEREMDRILELCKQQNITTRAQFAASGIILKVATAIKKEGADKRAQSTIKSSNLAQTYVYMRLSQGDNLRNCEKCL